MSSLNKIVAQSIGARSAVASRLPRVLYAVAMDPSAKFGSMEEQMVFLARAFQKEESLFLPLFESPGSQERPTPMEEAGVPIACLDMRRFRWHVLSELLSLIRHHKIDIVHWNFSSALSNSYLWWLTLLRPGVKHFFTDHTSHNFPLPRATGGWKKQCKRLLLTRYAKVICVSQFVFDCLQAQGTWSNLVCCKHFVNPARFRPDRALRASVRTDLNAEGRFVLLTVAHLIKAKGVDVALRALTLLPDSVVLWVIGAGPEADQLRMLTQELELTQRVVFLGPQRHVERFMPGADCLVCPSVWAEAAGLVNLEAQSSGLPVIAANVGGIPEYVVHGRTGLLFPPGDVEALARHVRRLQADAAYRQRLGEAARGLVEQQFSPAALLSETMALYRG